MDKPTFLLKNKKEKKKTHYNKTQTQEQKLDMIKNNGQEKNRLKPANTPMYFKYQNI